MRMAHVTIVAIVTLLARFFSTRDTGMAAMTGMIFRRARIGAIVGMMCECRLVASPARTFIVAEGEEEEEEEKGGRGRGWRDVGRGRRRQRET